MPNARRVVAWDDLSALALRAEAERRAVRRAAGLPLHDDDAPLPPIRPARTPRAVPTEHQEQAAFVRRARALAVEHPDVALLYAIPNFLGHAGRRGARMRAAQRATAEGRVAGMPDLHLPVARGVYHGLWIELKRARGGKLSGVQVAIHARLRAAGHCVVVAAGAEDAERWLLAYLMLGPGEALPRA